MVLPLIAGVLLAAPVAAQWEGAEVVVLAGSEADEEACRFSLAVGQADTPHAVWLADLGARRGVFYAWREGDVWTEPIEVSVDEVNCFDAAMALVPETTTRVVAFEAVAAGETDHEVYLATWNGTGFDVLRLTDNDAPDRDPALALDPSGRYHLVCVTQVAGQWRLRYLTDVTGEPSDQIVTAGPLGDFGSGAMPCIAVESTGVAHIAYRGILGPLYRVHCATNTVPGGEIWTWQAMTSGNVEDFSSDIEIDSHEGVHLAVSGNDCWGCNPRTYYFHRPAGGDWNPYVFIPLTMGLSTPSLALDVFDLPHVAMSEVSGNIYTGRLYYASAANFWTPVLVIGTDHGTPCLAVDSSGFGHLTCMTGPNTGVEDVLYLHSTEHLVDVDGAAMDPIVATPAATPWAAPNPFSDAVVVRAGAWAGHSGLPGPVVRVYDAFGRLVRQLWPEIPVGRGYRSTWDGRDVAGAPVAPGVYHLRMGEGQALRVVKVR